MATAPTRWHCELREGCGRAGAAVPAAGAERSAGEMQRCCGGSLIELAIARDGFAGTHHLDVDAAPLERLHCARIGL